MLNEHLNRKSRQSGKNRMKTGENQNFDIDAYRQQFHKYAYLRKPVGQQSQDDLGPISSLFSRRIAPSSGTIAPNKISPEVLESSALPKEASELLAELIGLEQSDIKPQTTERGTPALNATTYEIPSLTEKEVRERPIPKPDPPILLSSRHAKADTRKLTAHLFQTSSRTGTSLTHFRSFTTKHPDSTHLSKVSLHI
jgi:hypothetical protein